MLKRVKLQRIDKKEENNIKLMSPFTFVIAGAQRILCFFVVVFLLSSPYCLI